MANQFGVPDRILFEYFTSVLANHSQFHQAIIYCDHIDALRRAKANENPQEVSRLAAIGVTCDFVRSLCGYAMSLNSSNSPEDSLLVVRKCLGVLAYFWKPQFSRLEWKTDEGLFHYLENVELLAGLVVCITALLFVNHQQLDPKYQEKVIFCFENYPNFAKYHHGLLQCWNDPDQRFSSRVSPDGIITLRNVAKAILTTLHKQNPNHSIFLLQYADILYEEGEHSQAFKFYLLSGAVTSAYFSNPSTVIEYSASTLRRMITCLCAQKAITQALVLSQLTPNGDYSAIFRLAQNTNSFESKYFQFLWDVPILEVMVSIFTKMKDEKNASTLIQLLQHPDVNQNNLGEPRARFMKVTIGFFKELAREFLP